MERNVVRLEVLKLACSGSRDIQEILGRAKEFESFVMGPEQTMESEKASAKDKTKAGPAQKKNGNSDILS